MGKELESFIIAPTKYFDIEGRAMSYAYKTFESLTDDDKKTITLITLHREYWAKELQKILSFPATFEGGRVSWTGGPVRVFYTRT